ncbi:MAG: hypothetical protein ACREDO_06475 [Methyloceanibacter sp.]
MTGDSIAAPTRFIILRHGEKTDDRKVCGIGEPRAKALAQRYLGRDAVKSLFVADDPPAFFFAITLHTVELASPAVEIWNKPLIFYSVMPQEDENAFTKALNARTQEAARNIVAKPALKGKTVGHDLGTSLHRQCGPRSQVRGRASDAPSTFQARHLPGVPPTWADETFDLPTKKGRSWERPSCSAFVGVAYIMSMPPMPPGGIWA